MKTQQKGLLLGALVLGIVGAVFVMIGGMTCGLCVACTATFGEVIVDGEVVSPEDLTFILPVLWAFSASAIASGILGLIGAIFVMKGTKLGPVLMLVAGILSLPSVILINIIGLLGSILLIVAAIIGFVGGGAKPTDNFNYDQFNNFNDPNQFNNPNGFNDPSQFYNPNPFNYPNNPNQFDNPDSSNDSNNFNNNNNNIQ